MRTGGTCVVGHRIRWKQWPLGSVSLYGRSLHAGTGMREADGLFERSSQAILGDQSPTRLDMNVTQRHPLELK